MAVYRCRLIPLTPIHVGAGGTIALEDYFIQENRLVRFRPGTVVRGMAPEVKKRYLALLGGAEQTLPDSLKLLREEAQKMPASWVYSIEVGAASRQALTEAVGKVDSRRGEVHPLQWNEVKRCAVIPGSAIKGAIRTALLSARVAGKGKKEGSWIEGWKTRIEAHGQNPKRVAALAQELEQEVFRKGERGLEHDPFRFLKVSDVEVPGEFVRLDRVMLLARTAENQSSKIQMHFERIVSAADGEKAPELEFDLTLEHEEKRWHVEMQRYLGEAPTKERLVQSLRFHYDARLHAEMHRFGDLYRDAGWNEWRSTGKNGENCLIRLGRFSHFESLSTEMLRRTLDRRQKWITEGTSRTYCTPDLTKKLPFGWALLQFS